MNNITEIPLFQVDSFTKELFSGNPAAVCPLEKWLPDSTLRNIAAENNLSETAFYVHESDSPRIRWFTPTSEVDLCGHATLAAAYIFFLNNPELSTVTFSSKSGPLSVTKNPDSSLSMDFPQLPPSPVKTPDLLEAWLGNAILDCQINQQMDFLLVLDSPQTIQQLSPDFDIINKLPGQSLIITARNHTSEFHFVSRFFAPKLGIPEDPATGFTHCILAPYWADKLFPNWRPNNSTPTLIARQLSKRGGEIRCTLSSERVQLTGYATLFFKGKLFITQ